MCKDASITEEPERYKLFFSWLAYYSVHGTAYILTYRCIQPESLLTVCACVCFLTQEKTKALQLYESMASSSAKTKNRVRSQSN